MPTTIPTERLDFTSRSSRCSAWLTLPAADGPHPGVVLVHGLGATHDMMLAQYEQHFAAAGIATLAFDYRNTGDSDGQPRQHISVRKQCDDVAAALTHLGGHPRVDAARVGLWGTSLGAMNVIRVAAVRDDVAVAVVQCPIVRGVDGFAMVTVAGAESGWKSTVPPGGWFDNRIAAADAVAFMTVSALRHARRVQAPLLVCVCDRETLMDPGSRGQRACRRPGFGAR